MNHRGKVSLAERVVNVVETQGLEDRRPASCFVLFCFSSDYKSQVQVGGDVEVVRARKTHMRSSQLDGLSSRGHRFHCLHLSN